MNDRRRFERVERSLVTYYRKLSENSLEYAAVTTNVSRGGILVELEGDNLELGDMLSMEMVLSAQDSSINFVARLVRKEQTLMGLEFVQIKGEDEKKLHDYLAARENRDGPSGNQSPS